MEGEMVNNFIDVVDTKDAAVIAKGMHYFGGSDDGSMKTGSQSVKDDNGDTFKFYFGTKNSATENKGVGITGNKNNKLYYEGHLVAAEDYKYQTVTFGGKTFIVNQNGSIQHSAVEYKEDGDVLIDAKTSKVGYYTTTGWDKYAVKDEFVDGNDANGELIVNVEEIDESRVMAITGVYDPTTPDDASPSDAQ